MQCDQKHIGATLCADACPRRYSIEGGGSGRKARDGSDGHIVSSSLSPFFLLGPCVVAMRGMVRMTLFDASGTTCCMANHVFQQRERIDGLVLGNFRKAIHRAAAE